MYTHEMFDDPKLNNSSGNTFRMDANTLSDAIF